MSAQPFDSSFVPCTKRVGGHSPAGVTVAGQYRSVMPGVPRRFVGRFWAIVPSRGTTFGLSVLAYPPTKSTARAKRSGRWRRYSAVPFPPMLAPKSEPRLGSTVRFAIVQSRVKSIRRWV
ncbi:MAG: hypothetical protein CMJ84_02715 [Planctomycetes bacterium]|nr:hypothetical protein [Planctomycetota bacterium]